MSNIESLLAQMSPTDQDAFIQMIMSQGAGNSGDFTVDPFGQEALTGGLPLSLNSKKKIEPWDVGVAQASTNLQKAYNTNFADPVTAMFAGPGAYDVGAFDPTYEPIGSPVQATGKRMIERTAGMSEDDAKQMAASGQVMPASSWDQYVAQQMLTGKTANQAMGMVRSIMLAPRPSDPGLGQQYDAIKSSLVPNTPRYDNVSGKPIAADPTTPEGFDSMYDIGGMTKQANDLFKGMVSDPDVGYVDPQTGLAYAGAKTVDSPEAAWYKKQGLPLPTAAYDDPTYTGRAMDAAAPWSQERQDQADQGDITAKTNLDTVTKAYEAAMKNRNDVNALWQKQDQAGRLGQLTDMTPWMAQPGQQPAAPQLGGPVPGNNSYASGATVSQPVAGLSPRGVPPALAVHDNYTPGAPSARGVPPTVAVPSGGAGGAPSARGNPAAAGGPTLTGSVGPLQIDRNQYVAVDPVTGDITPWNFDQPVSTDAGAGLTGTVDLTGQGKKTKRKVTAADAADPNNSVLNASLALRSAVRANREANYQLDPDEFARAMAKVTMQKAAAGGRTPLRDAVTQRLLQQKSQGVYGY